LEKAGLAKPVKNVEKLDEPENNGVVMKKPE
jgi:hypothetical protein